MPMPYYLLFILSIIKAHNITFPFSKMMLSTDIVSYIQTTFITILHIGTPKQPMLFYITNSNFNTICISSRLFNESASSSYENLNKDYSFTTKKHKKLIGNYSSDRVHFKGIEVTDVNFIVLKQKNALNINDGVLGLDIAGSQFNSSQIGIIDQLYHKGLISYRTFGISFDEETDIGTLSLGVQSPRFSFELINYQWCSIPKAINAWICLMKPIKNTYLNISEVNKALFKIDYAFIVCPEVYFKYITDVYLAIAINDKICKVMSSTKDEVVWIECDKKLNTKQLKPLSYEFDTLTFTLEPKDLFITLPFHNETMVFGIVKEKKSDEFDWIFGDIALSQFNLTFDFENRTIFFSNEYIIEENERKASNKIWVFLIYTSIVVLVLLGIWFYSRFKSKKRNISQIHKDWNSFMKLEALNLQS